MTNKCFCTTVEQNGLLIFTNNGVYIFLLKCGVGRVPFHPRLGERRVEKHLIFV